MVLLDERIGRTGGRLTVTDSDTGTARAAALHRIATREAAVAVIGLGYVGLPLAVAFAEAGFRTVGVDVDAHRVAGLNAGESHISDIPSSRLAPLVAGSRRAAADLFDGTSNGRANGHSRNGHGQANGHGAPAPARVGSFAATTDFDALFEVDAVIICVPTPLGRTKDPDMSYIEAAADAIALRLHPGMLVVLESTTYPGTTEEVILPRLEAAPLAWSVDAEADAEAGDQAAGESRPVVGRDFFLAFSPERIDPGRTDWTVKTTPKVVGGVTPACSEVTRALYSTAIDRVVPVSGPKEAEMVKLLENTFRAVNIGLVNELAIMCDHLGVDVWEVIEAAKTKPFGFMPFYPGPGLGGHCIPIDPQYLAWKLRTLDYHARFIQLAADVNLNMPHHVLGKVADALNEDGKAVNGSRVLVLGVAYKADISDMRESPALDVIRLLREKGARVEYHDPHVPSFRLGGETFETVELDEAALAGADCVVVTTAHAAYDWNWVGRHARVVVDTRNAMRAATEAGCAARVVRL